MFNMIDENGTYRVLTKYSAENDMGMCTLAAGGKIRLRGYLAKMVCVRDTQIAYLILLKFENLGI